MRMGTPRLLTSDNGSEFRNELDTKLMELLKIKHIFTTPYHPQVKAVIIQHVKYTQHLACLLVYFTLALYFHHLL